MTGKHGYKQRGLIIISALEEAGALSELLPKLQHGLRREDGSSRAEILVVDDGSRDSTAEVAREHGATVLVNERTRGKLFSVHRAMRHGLEHMTASSKESFHFFVTCDGDGQHPMKSILNVIEEINNGHDVIFTSRYSPDSPDGTGNTPIDRQLLNRAIRGMIDAVIPWGLTDPLCGLRGFKPWVVKWILEQEFVTDHYGHELETLLRLWHLREVESQDLTLKEILIPPVYDGAGKIGMIYGMEFLHARAERARLHLEHITYILNDLGIRDLRNIPSPS